MCRGMTAGKTPIADRPKECGADKEQVAMDVSRGGEAESAGAEATLLGARSAHMAGTATMRISTLIVGGIGLCPLAAGLCRVLTPMQASLLQAVATVRENAERLATASASASLSSRTEQQAHQRAPCASAVATPGSEVVGMVVIQMHQAPGMAQIVAVFMVAG